MGVHIWEDTKEDGKMRCADYVRVSTEDQKDNGFSIDSQLIMIKEYLDYLNEIIKNNEIGITYKGMINEEELKELSENYLSFSLSKYENKKYSKSEIEFYKQIISEHFYQDGIIECPFFDGENISDRLLLIPKNPAII